MRFKEGENVHVIVGNELLSGWYNGKEFGTGNSLVKVSKDKIIATKDCFIAKEKEPELVVVPRFADDWINHCEQREYDLACLLDYGNAGMPDEMYEWLISSADNQELLARAWLDGYEVEKEPLYYVRLPLSTWNDDAAELEVINMYVLLNVQSDETSITGSIINENKEWRTKLTEAEIKGIPGGEIYWQFAVLVEEAEA
ncbi:TPA_asm: hypothetical protein GHD47_03210 [Listeria monocytogenes]|uniref:DUF1642 domain-containing protein n=2 Tax=Listeria monocytogenes TaxID=1639 RepID=UPI0010B76666|nr:DUF1642 domain-containing protein [Listeria monocytogenes]EAC3128999.1 DUF1642 domain-containing protein [Listeria monocytogenes]EAC5660224.1 DUF1642 domain-containing protein [Listeria monocytogenes]EAD0734760.1 DUF1642 domain-containing protein [Listeria monocytogenes]EAD1419013.1 DUF1642 domain-containing protein [Listeria monocytogenes]EAD2119296.1 DUF1642 domain-containing protein [Listeria monocytogenes]